MARIVIALGGNALGSDYLEQQKLIKNASYNLIDLIKNNEVIITHGNGPQVGMITKSFNDEQIIMPLDICTAMSQGDIGFHIQRELKEVLNTNQLNRDVVTVITEVLVDEADPAFLNPTKPIGKFYSKDEAQKLMQNTKDLYIEDAGRGYRKVVASPKPVDIKNLSSIEALLKNNTIVIAAGGGGVPVFNNPETTGVDAVIDKDLASSLLAKKVHADALIILTTVNQVMLNFNTDKEINIAKMNIEEANEYLKKGEFKKGSMAPKVEAAIDFTSSSGKETIITSLDNVKNVLTKYKTTTIYKK